MKSKTKILIVIAIIVVILISGWWIYENYPEAQDSYIGENKIIETGKIININKDNYNQMYPNVYRDKIVWVDLRYNVIEECECGYIVHQPCTSEIYLLDITTNVTKKITNSDTWKVNPQLSDNYVIWHEYKNQITYENESDIAMNLNTGQKFILEDGYSWKLLSNDKVIYINSGIYIMDLSTKERTKLVEQKPGEYTDISNIDASEEYLIWLEEFWETGGRSGKKIHALNMKTKQESILDEFIAAYGIPKIYEDKIIWENFDNLNPERPALEYQDFNISLFNLSTEKKSKIISGEDAQTTPNIHGNYITYVDFYGNDSYKIYNIANEEIQTIKTHCSFSPYNGVKIHNNIIVWTDHENCSETSDDVYMLILKSP
jgi:hypothetical protein